MLCSTTGSYRIDFFTQRHRCDFLLAKYNSIALGRLQRLGPVPIRSLTEYTHASRQNMIMLRTAVESCCYWI